MRLLPLVAAVSLLGACTVLNQDVPDAEVTVLRTLDSGFWEWKTPRGLDLLSIETGNTNEVGVYLSMSDAEGALEPLSLNAELSAVSWDEESVVLGLYWISSHGDEWLELTTAQVRNSAVQVQGIDHRQLDEDGAFLSMDASAVLYSVVVTSALPTEAGGTLTVEPMNEPHAE